MAIYHLAVKTHARSSGASAVAAAAYRAGERLTDEHTGERHDYERRGGVDGSEIHAPDGAPEWARNRRELWNAVEAAERRKDARLAREVVVALPAELSQEQRRHLVRGYVRSQFVDRGMVADVAYHDGKGHNPHAHVLLTTRQIGPDCFGAKVRAWNDRDLVNEWRAEWSAQTNHALARAGRSERVDHRSLAAQRDAALDRGDVDAAARFDRVPDVHLGRAAWKAIREAEPNAVTAEAADVGQENRELKEERAGLRQMIDRIEQEIRLRTAAITREVIAQAREIIDRTRGPSRGWEHGR